jgi:Zn-dependent protease with chaperone function
MIMRRLCVFAGVALMVVAQADTPVGGLPGTVYRDNVVVRAKAAPDAAAVTTLKRSSPVVVDLQDGLWFQMHTPDSKAGFVRINEVRLTQTKRAGGSDNMQVLMRGGAGHGNVSETAGVRGLDESTLKAAAFDANALAAMDANRVAPSAGDRYARSKHLAATQFPYPAESEGAQKPQQNAQAQQAEQAPPPSAPSRNPFANIGGAFRGLRNAGSAGNALDAALTPQEAQDELALGPQIAGRVLGAAPLWNDPMAQQRVNVIGRWVASQTLRPDYPWTFAVIDMPEYNAFAAPGGYVFMTRGLYEVLQSDDEVAAVLAHEMSHVVQRDQYNVVRKQQTTKVFTDIGREQLVSHVGGSGVGGMASKAVVNYVAKFGASLILTHFDKSVEYRSDEAAEVYLVRAGYNPLAIYAVLQKLAGVSPRSDRLTTLSKTHPSAEDRLDSLDKRDMTAMQSYTSRRYVN